MLGSRDARQIAQRSAVRPQRRLEVLSAVKRRTKKTEVAMEEGGAGLNRDQVWLLARMGAYGATTHAVAAAWIQL